MEAEDDSSTSSEELPDDSDNDSDDSGSASDLEPDSEDEGMAGRSRNNKNSYDGSSDTSGDVKSNSEEKEDEQKEEKLEGEKTSLLKDNGKTTTYKQETTRSLAYQILDMDVGYSSDEGGDEDNAHYVSY